MNKLKRQKTKKKVSKAKKSDLLLQEKHKTNKKANQQIKQMKKMKQKKTQKRHHRKKLRKFRFGGASFVSSPMNTRPNRNDNNGIFTSMNTSSNKKGNDQQLSSRNDNGNNKYLRFKEYSNSNGSYKKVFLQDNEGNWKANKPKDTRLMNKDIIFLGLKNKKKSTNNDNHIQKELNLQRRLANKNMAPLINHDFVTISKIDASTPFGDIFRGFYTEKMNYFHEYSNFSHTNASEDQYMKIWQSMLELFSTLIRKFGMINTDIKEENMVIQPDEIRPLYVDTDPRFFIQLYNPDSHPVNTQRTQISYYDEVLNERKNYQIEGLNVIAPFISLLQIVLMPPHHKHIHIFSLQQLSETNDETFQRRAKYLTIQINEYIKKYDITLEVFNDYLYTINQIVRSQNKKLNDDLFSPTELLYHYCMRHESQLSNNRVVTNKNGSVGNYIWNKFQMYYEMYSTKFNE